MADRSDNGATRGEFELTDRLQEIKKRVHRRLLETLNLNEARLMTEETLRRECSQRVDRLLNEQGLSLSTAEKSLLLNDVLAEMFGLGPIQKHLQDPMVTDILVNGPHQVYIERYGQLETTTTKFRDDEHVMQIIQRIASGVGRRIDESSPMLDARLKDGSRVNAIIPPLALDGPAVSIRRFGATPIDAPQLIDLQALSAEMLEFLQSCVQSRLNILISGGTGSGKTTMLNALSKWIPATERVVTIEDAAELQLQREHVVRLETRPANIENKGRVTQRALLRNSLRMRPDRIIIGEVRGEEALDMLQAMNTGHDGSMTTVHANNSRDALRRIENMVGMAGVNFPVHVVRDQIASALDLVIHLARLTGGGRRLMSVSEITGMEGDVVCLQDLFRFEQTGLDSEGRAIGKFIACGVRPRLIERLASEGRGFPPTFFERRVLLDVSNTKRLG